MHQDDGHGDPEPRRSESFADPDEARSTPAAGEPMDDVGGSSPSRRQLLRRVGTGVAVVAGAALAGCSGDGDGGDGSSEDEGSDGASTDDTGDGATGDGSGETTDSGDGSAEQDGSDGQDDSGSADGGQTFEAETPELQSALENVTGDWEIVDVEGTIQNEVDGLEVAESATLVSTEYSRFSVWLAMRNVGNETTRPYQYGYHLQAYGGDDQLLLEASSQSADGPRVDPEGVDVVTVTVGFSESDGAGLDDIARYESQINCEHAGGANPRPDGTYCR